MTLSKQDYQEYLGIHFHLLYFTGCYNGIFPENYDFKDFLNTRFEPKPVCRDVFLEEKDENLDELIGNNHNLPENWLSILNGFRKSVKGEFVFLKCLSKHSIFKNLENEKFYAVKALSDSFETLIPDYPAIVELCILPFKDEIIYDGFIKGGNIKIGKNIHKSLNEEYKQAKENKEIIYSLK